MSVKLLAEQHLEFLSLKEAAKASESTLVKRPHSSSINKQCGSWLDGFVISRLIWIYTVFKSGLLLFWHFCCCWRCCLLIRSMSIYIFFPLFLTRSNLIDLFDILNEVVTICAFNNTGSGFYMVLGLIWIQYVCQIIIRRKHKLQAFC